MVKEIIEDGVMYYIGENAQDNWDIIKIAKKENQNYVWFHLHSLPSAHVIICKSYKEMKNDGDWKYNKKIAARFITQNSKYKNLQKIKVVCASIKDIKKTNHVGEVTINKILEIF